MPFFAIRESSFQKLIKRLQLLHSPVLARSNLAQVPSQFHELGVPLRLLLLLTQARISSILVRTKRARRRLKKRRIHMAPVPHTVALLRQREKCSWLFRNDVRLKMVS